MSWLTRESSRDYVYMYLHGHALLYICICRLLCDLQQNKQYSKASMVSSLFQFLVEFVLYMRVHIYMYIACAIISQRPGWYIVWLSCGKN